MRRPPLHLRALAARLLATGLLLAGGHLEGVTQGGGTVKSEEEYVLKAKFLAKVCTFVDWPPGSTVQDPSRPFVIGILDRRPSPGVEPWDDPFVRSMRVVFRETILKNKKVTLKNVVTWAEFKECQAIYVMPRARAGIKLLMKGTQPLHILIFSQTEGFAELGVHLNFQVVDQRVRFEINESSFQDSGLKIDSLILRSAIVVKRRGAK